MAFYSTFFCCIMFCCCIVIYKNSGTACKCTVSINYPEIFDRPIDLLPGT